MHNTFELVINWHFTEACNYACDFCFAKWDKQGRKELFHDEYLTDKLLDEVFELKTILEDEQNTKFDGVRLNLVGGEIFLYKAKAIHIIKRAKSYGFRVSAITNGSRLDAELLSLIAENLDWIGFSVDSTNHKTNLIIGRSEKNKVMDTDKVRSDIHALRKLNAEIDIKINTVVNSNNFNEDLSGFIRDVNPSKWKIFKVLPSQGYTSTITDTMFSVFLDKHADFESIIASEDNNEMTDSYIMVDPLGRFFQNSNLTDGYVYSHPIVETGVKKALSQINFSFDKFLGRYNINEKLIDTVPRFT